MVTIMNTSSGDSLAIAVGTSSSSINHMVSDDDDGCPSSPGSAQFDEGGDLMAAAMGDEVTAQLAAAGWQNEHGDFTLLCFCFILKGLVYIIYHLFKD